MINFISIKQLIKLWKKTFKLFTNCHVAQNTLQFIYLKKLYIKSDSTHLTFKRNSFLELTIYPQTKFKQEKLILPKTCFVSTLFDPSSFKINQHQLLCKKISMLIFNNVKNQITLTQDSLLFSNLYKIFHVFKKLLENFSRF